ncbi:hypothetical protein PF010_g2654 [Phytophthora fragariae]|uniref:Amidohydrolase 3 domain-containing protein n=1 Tax=Phytophthora fragariae TaxID=53985 RepID=A0A6G0LWR5_9STRA|nr:hypothetical protein PF010_g2654 [Phytophthora fragariae]
MLTPSSNTILEPATYRMLTDMPEVSVHFSRFVVREISLTDHANQQFRDEPMLEAAGLLADAGVDLIVWNGTSASWLGLEKDRRFCGAVKEKFGIPAATSALALMDAYEALQVKRVGLVEVDPVTGLKSMEAALQLKALYRSLITIQLVVFPQEGIFQQAGTAELMKQAIAMGGDAVGGIPYNDTDALEHLEWVYRLASETGLPVDLHVDFSDNPEQQAILDIAALTVKYGLQGRVTVAHLTALGSMEPDEARAIAARMAAAEIHVITLPATDLYLNGRGDTHKPRRGLTPVRLLQEEGVNVCFGTNNIRNAFTPFGKGDPLDIAFLLAQTTYMGTRADAVLLLEMCTTRAAKALNLAYTTLAAGTAADFVLTGAQDICDLIYDRTPERIVWKNGIRTAETALNRFVLSP